MKRLKKNHIVLTYILFICFLFIACQHCAPINPLPGFSIKGDYLLDANGNVFVMRGINYPHVWFPRRYQSSLIDIASTGANCVRIVLGCGKQWGPTPASEVEDLIEVCKENKLIAILEVHDCTGYNDNPSAATIAQAVDYWISLKDVLIGQEKYVIINIANEPLGNKLTSSRWVTDHVAAIKRLRQAGFTHTIMIDAGNWGQDHEKIMLDRAEEVFKADNLKNLIFSVHMYEVYDTPTKVKDYLTAFKNRYDFPLVVGEFGWAHGENAEKNVAEEAILEYCNQLEIGYLGWSWCGNRGHYLDLVEYWDPEYLTDWGKTLIESEYGIRKTSALCTIFN